MMGLLRILLTEIPRESLARQHEQTATRAAARLYQETVRFGDAGSGFRKPDVMEEIGQWLISPGASSHVWQTRSYGLDFYDGPNGGRLSASRCERCLRSIDSYPGTAALRQKRPFVQSQLSFVGSSRTKIMSSHSPSGPFVGRNVMRLVQIDQPKGCRHGGTGLASAEAIAPRL
jgi:hypothetical protein